MRAASASSLLPKAGDCCHSPLAWSYTEKRYCRPILNTPLMSLSACIIASPSLSPLGRPAWLKERLGRLASTSAPDLRISTWSRISPASDSSTSSMSGKRERM